MRVLAVLCAVFLAVGCFSRASAQDSALSELHRELNPMRDRHANPQLVKIPSPLRGTVIRQLTAWIEAHLPASDSPDDDSLWARQMTDLLKEADLLEPANNPEPPDYSRPFSSLGFIRNITTSRQYWERYLIVDTGLGRECGYQSLAYAFRWNGTNWRADWRSQDTESDALPHALTSVLISPPLDRTESIASDKSDHLVLALGHYYNCQSNWYPVTYQIWRVGAARKEPRLLFDRVEYAFLGPADPPIMGSIGPTDALIEFTVGSIDIDVLTRPAIRHLLIGDERVSRISPIALSPRDFVEEWLKSKWDESSGWSPPSARSRLKTIHDQLYRDEGRVGDEFLGAPKRCGAESNRWQVGITFDASDDQKRHFDRYFVIRWDPPYEFSLVDASDRSSPACTIADSEDKPRPTLFPIQEWR